MNYKLAKQLNDAGFPSKERIGPQRVTPTLSELIEACGDMFGYLARKEDYWGDGKTRWITNSDGTHEDIAGLTPEESVVKLWLKLNE